MLIAIARKLHRDERAATLVEFALIAPVLITMMIGVLQVGTWVQSYNAVRNVVNDTTRFAMVEYQRGNKISDEAIEDRALEIAGSGKYNLDESLFVPDVTVKATEVAGIRQRRLVVTYTAPEFMPVIGTLAPAISYGRDIYLYDQSATVAS
ncbi:TadE-like protein [Tsuneonella dongtanensis]|uniref:TadE-like protein n=2 Tax=Tsuneonella dongtanensis TaxID=692370 RepID=A0A1B2AEX9_9SPHN|nr:TadE-like protein [Tsuneonella dongtanensis]